MLIKQESLCMRLFCHVLIFVCFMVFRFQITLRITHCISIENLDFCCCGFGFVVIILVSNTGGGSDCVR